MTPKPTYLSHPARQALIDRLHAEQCSCVVGSGDAVRTFRGRGVQDLWRLLHEEPELLRGAFVADKVVGKGAAALMIAGGVAELFADVISEQALDLLARSDVRVTYAAAVPHIVNRAHTGWCPVETLCRDCRTAAECLPRIEEFIRQMNEHK